MNHLSTLGNKGESLRASRKGWPSLHSTRRESEDEAVILYSRIVRKVLFKITNNLCEDCPEDCIPNRQS